MVAQELSVVALVQEHRGRLQEGDAAIAQALSMIRRQRLHDTRSGRERDDPHRDAGPQLVDERSSRSERGGERLTRNAVGRVDRENDVDPPPRLLKGPDGGRPDCHTVFRDRDVLRRQRRSATDRSC